MQITTPVTIGNEVNETLDALRLFCQQRQLQRFFLIADHNTYAVLGGRVQQALGAAGIDVRPIILLDEHVVADEQTIVQVLLQTGDGEQRHFLACGSGTLTDITRFIAHRTRSHFICLPTAPSVDGYLSRGSPLVIEHLKQTVNGLAPMAIFADLPTLCAAPPAMIAAGYGDVIGKFTSLADWKLGHLLWDEPYDATVAEWAYQVVAETAPLAQAIARAETNSIRRLFEALLKTGQSMIAVGDSRPASGTEHHLSHFWEMVLLLGGRPPVLHGAKVGIGTIWGLRKYETIRTIERSRLKDLLEAAELPDPEKEREAIRQYYGPAAEETIALQAPFLEMTPGEFDALKQRIWEQWDEIQDLAQTLPSSTQVQQWLEAVGGPTDIKQLGLTAAEEQNALDHAHFLRNRFTMNKLFHVLGLRIVSS